jgi:hypothetical protein
VLRSNVEPSHARENDDEPIEIICADGCAA